MSKTLVAFDFCFIPINVHTALNISSIPHGISGVERMSEWKKK